MGLVLNVVCVYKPGNGFTDEYVYRLRTGVQQHCKAPHRFVCLTNERLNVETIPLIRNRTGFWNKLELFRKKLFDDQVVYLDLDTIIGRDVTDIFTYPHTFTGLNDFADKRAHQFASAFMAWDGRQDLSHLDENFTAADIAEYSKDYARWGDQGYIAEDVGVPIDLTRDLFPDRFVSYKWHVRRQGKVPDTASVVCFHGKPRPADIGWRLP